MRDLFRRPLVGRIAGLFLLLAIVGLPVLSGQGTFLFWDSVAVDGFAASTGWRFVGTGGAGEIKMDLVSIVGHNTTGTNQYQFHESTDLAFTLTVTEAGAVPLSDTVPVMTNYADVAVGTGGCCGAPHAACSGDGSCTTGFRGADGLFRELKIQDGTATSMVVDKTATNQLSATADRYAAGLLLTTVDTVAGNIEIYAKPDGANSYTPVRQAQCDSPLTNLHWGTVADPLDDWLITGCREGTNITIRQIQIPGGTIDWFESVATVPNPNDFRYIQLDQCGSEITFPDLSVGPAVAYAIPRNTDTVIGVMGPVAGPAAPAFNITRIVSGTHGDYYAFDCVDDLVTMVRAHPSGTGMQFVHLDFDDFSGNSNLMSGTDPSTTPIWINTAPDWTADISNEASLTPAHVNTPYLPLVIKSTGGLQGGQVTYGSVERVLFFDGFESGDTSFWDTTVGGAAGDG